MYRIMGLWQPTERFSVSAFYLEQANHRDDLSIANNLSGSFTRTDTPGPSSSRQSFSVANLDMRYNLDWATLISETSRNTKLQDLNYDASAGMEALAGQGVQSLRTAQRIHSNSISEELRLVSAPGESPWQWIGGTYYSHYEADVDDNITLANSPLLDTLLALLQVPPPYPVATSEGVSLQRTQYTPLKAEEESLFGELTRRWGAASLTLGGRAYRETLSTDVQLSGLVTASFNGRKTMTSEGFNPKASLTWQIDKDLLWYANASHGFQFGGLNVPAAIPADNTFRLTYKPSTLWSYESGIRADAFNNTLQLDVAGFLINWKDMQIQQRTPDGVSTYTANVGRARSKGIESSIRWLTPIKGLMLINTAAYTRAQLVEPYTAADGTFVSAGTDLPAAPRLQTSLTLAYSTTVGAVHTGTDLTFSHLGKAASDVQRSIPIYGYNTLDFNYTLSFPRLFFAPTFTLNVINLTDRRALVGGQIDYIGGIPEGELGSYLRPRTIALRISGQF
jgi:outer membrane receptor protein involved in Fe transport